MYVFASPVANSFLKQKAGMHLEALGNVCSNRSDELY